MLPSRYTARRSGTNDPLTTTGCRSISSSGTVSDRRVLDALPPVKEFLEEAYRSPYVEDWFEEDEGYESVTSKDELDIETTLTPDVSKFLTGKPELSDAEIRQKLPLWLQDKLPAFLPRHADTLPPRRAWDHKIELMPGKEPPYFKNRPLSPLELEVVLYTKLDIIAAVNKLRIAEGDEWKTAFITRFGLFESLVMPFGLCNAPASFQHYINHTLFNELDKYCTAYLDDVLVYSADKSEHREHVRTIVQKLADAGLQIDINKCEFETVSTRYLGLIITTNSIQMDPEKVTAITSWEQPLSVKDLQRFLGDAFATLKDAFITAPVLAYFDHNKRTVLETDASDWASGGVLSQYDSDGLLRPVAYFSAKHSAAECNYEIYDKELLAIIKSMEEWRPELQGSQQEFEILTDHKNLERFEPKEEDRPNFATGDDERLKNRERIVLPADKFDIDLYNELKAGIHLAPTDLVVPAEDKPIDELIDDAYKKSKYDSSTYCSNRGSSWVRTLTTEELVDVFISRIYTLHGLPDNIISDRGTQFVSGFWSQLSERLAVTLRHSSAFHPQTDGQTERIDSVLEQYLRAFVNFHQDDWMQWLPLAEFASNIMTSETTGCSPFFANYGFNPHIGVEPSKPCPPDMTIAQKREFFKGNKTADRMERILSQLQALARQAVTIYEENANQHRIDSPTLLYRPKGDPRKEDGKSEPVQKWIFEGVIDNHNEDGHHYLVKWKHYAPTWQPAADLKGNEKLLAEYHRTYPEKPGPPRRVLDDPEAKAILSPTLERSEKVQGVRRSTRERKSQISVKHLSY
ncbi:hypothetical protein DID88_004743 [Monilinia fructigena]|uniref:Chromo domain-containing protein n=1 Tax=Monilinia fructigena TaxID=38457 RepID=A0A395IRI6_9HELO|nr:hypothetical protein DID88_004743 [Monilinia fructigena]